MNNNNEIAFVARSACESDRSWTVHHVFTGLPSNMDGVTMSGLDRSDATNIKLALNRGSVLKERAHNALLRSRLAIPGAGVQL